MLEARKAGANYREIARMFDVSPATAHAGVKRALRKEGARYAEEIESIGWLISERYDTLLRDLIPFTKPQKITDPQTGEEHRVPPSFEAVDRVLKILNEQKKMFGLDKDVISIEGPRQSGPTVGDESTGEITPEDYATKVLSELIKVGAIGGDDASKLQAMMGQEIIDAEVIEESPVAEIAQTSGVEVPSLVHQAKDDAPEWVDEDDEDYQPGNWIPDEMGNASELE